MKYDLQPNPVIPLNQVVVGSTTDARWRACKGSAYRGKDENGDRVFRIDSLIAHEMEREYEAELVAERRIRER